MQTKNIQYKNTSISYRVTGNGKPVIFIHGFAEDSRIWDGIIEKLKGSYQLIIPDIPGSGKSGILPGDNISIADYASVMEAILVEEQIVQCAIIGHSMGGYISLAFAERYPEKINSLGLFHSSAYADDEPKKETRRKAINIIKEKGTITFL
ncbi:MAG: alpha/beta hydrolase, partial [Rhizobacter sp.]|nr:alpha/beta hydrolase [Ferruginibacter sp.]